MQSWKIAYSDSYLQSLKKFFKSHLKKEKKLKKEILDFIKEIEMELLNNPLENKTHLFTNQLEPLPKGIDKEKLENIQFRKLRFDIPKLTGSLSKGRILFQLDEKEKTIYLLYFYTHKDFEKRPNNNLIVKLFKF